MEQKSIFNNIADGFTPFFEGRFKFVSVRSYDFTDKDSGDRRCGDIIKLTNGIDSFEFAAPFDSGATEIKPLTDVLVKFAYEVKYNKGYKNQKLTICGIYTK